MDKLDKILSSMPKAKFSRQVDIKVKFKLYRLIFLEKLKSFNALPAYKMALAYKGLAFILAVTAIFSATSIYAYASNDIIPGTPLYPLKIAIEKIEQKIAITSTAKIDNYEKISNRRLQEAVNLSQQENKIVSEKINKNIDTNIANNQKIKNSINKLSDSEAVAAILQAKKRDQKELESLNKIADFAKNRNDEAVLQKVNEAREIINHQEYKQDEEIKYQDIKTFDLQSDNDENNNINNKNKETGSTYKKEKIDKIKSSSEENLLLYNNNSD